MSRVLRRTGGALAVTAILLAGGCTADEGEPTSAPEPPAPEVPADPPVTDEETTDDEESIDEDAAEVPVLLVDGEVMLPASIFPAGRYIFVVEQEGDGPYMLTIEGPGVSESTDEVEPGVPEELFVTLEPGTYEVWSSVNGDREDGSEVTIEVE